MSALLAKDKNVVPLHRVRFAGPSGDEIEIEALLGSGVEAGIPPSLSEVVYWEAEASLQLSVTGVPPMCWRDTAHALFHPYQLRENTEYLIDITLSNVTPADLQAGELASYWPFNPQASKVFRRDPPRRWRRTPEGKLQVSGRLRLGSFVGVLDLSIANRISLLCEVAPAKLSYFDDFVNLMNGIAEHIVEIALSLDAPTSMPFGDGIDDILTDLGLLFRVRWAMLPDNLPTAVEEILSFPHVMLTTIQGSSSLKSNLSLDASRLHHGAYHSDFQQGGPYARLFRGYSPHRFPISDTADIVDTPENRYVKDVLQHLLSISSRLNERLTRSKKVKAATEAEGWVNQISDWLSHDIWKDVRDTGEYPTNSQVLHRRKGYRDFLRLSTMLFASFDLPWSQDQRLADGVYGGIRPIYELYEYWCFFKIKQILDGLCEPVNLSGSSLVSDSSQGLGIRLKKGTITRVSYTYRATSEVKVHLFYNRQFRRKWWSQSGDGTYTVRLDPDISILIVVGGSNGRRKHWLHFDAKYRLDSSLSLQTESEDWDDLFDSDMADDTDAEEMMATYNVADIYKMHTYRDAIIEARGSYVLYPGHGNTSEMFIKHPKGRFDGDNPTVPSVGAFPLNPNGGSSQMAPIEKFLKEVLSSLSDGKDYCEETGLF